MSHCLFRKPHRSLIIEWWVDIWDWGWQTISYIGPLHPCWIAVALSMESNNFCFSIWHSLPLLLVLQHLLMVSPCMTKPLSHLSIHWSWLGLWASQWSPRAHLQWAWCAQAYFLGFCHSLGTVWSDILETCLDQRSVGYFPIPMCNWPFSPLCIWVI